MRKKIKIPRVIKIYEVKGLRISVMFNNGEIRIIDFKKLFEKLKINANSPENKLLDPTEFKKVKLNNYTLSWMNAGTEIIKKDGEVIKLPYEIGADTLYKHSEPDTNMKYNNLGNLLKSLRKKSGITQEELASKTGTTRFYISRIENNKSDIELSTLFKIVEAGLGKKLHIDIK